MFFMNKKSRMCDNCKHIRIVKQIKSEEEYLTIIEEIKKLLSDGKYEMVANNCPIDALKTEDGYWVDDGIWHTIQCKECGTLFTCSVDTYHGFGSFRKGK